MAAMDDHARCSTAALSRHGRFTHGRRRSRRVQDLSGGVSCDVWQVTLGSGRQMVVKRALPALRVTAEWRAPVERSSTEVARLRLVAKLEPQVGACTSSVRIARGICSRWNTCRPNSTRCGKPNWRTAASQRILQLRSAQRWRASTQRPRAPEAIAQAFANDAQFTRCGLSRICCSPRRSIPILRGQITALASGVARARIALMQGDISPKNILCGPHGPVFLDAETACYGDPALDLAFCLNHLLLKSVWHPEHADAYRAAFSALKGAYNRGVDWEDASDTDARIAALLPALLLARVDGKSPVRISHRGEGQKLRARERRARC